MFSKSLLLRASRLSTTVRSRVVIQKPLYQQYSQQNPHINDNIQPVDSQNPKEILKSNTDTRTTDFRSLENTKPANNPIERQHSAVFDSEEIIEAEIQDSAVFNSEEIIEAEKQDSAVFNSEEIIEAEKQDSLPWYMRESADDSSFIPKIQDEFEMPELPEGSPESLNKIINHMGNQLSLDSVKVIDMSKVENSAATNFSKYMILCNGKSSKHVMKAGILLYKYLKDQYQIVPSMEGLTHLSTKKMNKKMKKNVGKKAKSAVDGYYGDAASVPNSWIMIDSFVDGIYINLLTSERREELNLEYLWASKEEKAKINEEKKKLRESYKNESSFNNVSDDIFKGIRYYHTSRNVEANDSQLVELEKLPKEELQEIFKVATFHNNKTGKLKSILSKSPVVSNEKGREILKKYQSLFSFIDSSKFCDVYDFAEFLVYNKIAEPIILNEILKNNGKALTSEHISQLFTSLNHCIVDGLTTAEAEQYLECIWDIFEGYSFQGNHSLNLSDLAVQNNILKLTKIIFKVPEEVTRVVESAIRNPRIMYEHIPDIVQINSPPIFSYNKRGTLINLISEKLKKTYSLIDNEYDLEKFILFKNEFLMTVMTYYAHHASWVEFWNLWKDEDFTFAFSDKLNIRKYDSRPWFSFLCLCYSTKAASSMSHALNYWDIYYRQNSIDLESNANLKEIVDAISNKLNISTI